MRPSRRRRLLSIGIASWPALAYVRVLAQSKALPRVALVYEVAPLADMLGADPVNPFARAFVHALRDLGLEDGRNVVIERRSAEGRPERLAPLMQEVVASKVDVIVTVGSGVSAALKATSSIPIVAVISGERGLVSSHARPGGNLTGAGWIDEPELPGKWLQLLKEAAPRIDRVAVVAPAPPPGSRRAWRDGLEAAARSMQLALVWPVVDTADQYEPAFASMVRERANALVLADTNLNNYHMDRVAAFAIRQKMPSFSNLAGFAQSGGLLSYGGSMMVTFRRVAAQVKRILDGTKPGDIPFEQPERAELVINARTAKAIGLALPQTLLARADQVIK